MSAISIHQFNSNDNILPLNSKLNTATDLAAQVDLDQARQFLRLLGPNASEFCFQTFSDRKPKGGPDPLAMHKTGSFEALKDWLIGMNQRGAGIFVTVNETDGKGRSIPNITSIRAVFRELDIPAEEAGMIGLEPSGIVESSPGKTHEYFLCAPADPLDPADFEGVQRFLVDVAGSDKNARDLARVLRLPGFFHCKGEPVRVRLLGGNGRRYTKSEITTAFPPINLGNASAAPIDGDLEYTPANEALVRSIIAAIPGDKVESRDDWLRFGFALARLGDDWETEDYTDLRPELWHVLASKAPSWQSETGCDFKWDEIQRDAKRKGRQATIRTLLGAAQKSGWTFEGSDIVADLQPEALHSYYKISGVLSAVDEIYASLDPSLFVGFEENDPAPVSEAKRVRPRRQDVFDFVEVEPLKILIDDVLPAGSLYTFTAVTGHGKTEWCINAALALAFNRPDLIGKEIEPCRVLYMTAENPDMLKRRIGLSLRKFSIRKENYPGARLCCLGGFLTAVEMLKECREMVEEAEAAGEAFGLVIIDTLQSYFCGDNSNENAQVVKFMRSLRPITELAHKPAVIVPAHPTKNAGEDQLVPYGGGGIKNEIDGNLTCIRKGNIVSIHWQGKLRGIDFEPVIYHSTLESDQALTDHKGRPLPLPILRLATDDQAAVEEKQELTNDLRILQLLLSGPQTSARAIGRTLNIGKSVVARAMGRLVKAGYAKKGAPVQITSAGKKQWEVLRKNAIPRGGAFGIPEIEILDQTNATTH